MYDKLSYDFRMGIAGSEFVYKRNVNNFLNGSRTIKSATRAIEKIKSQEIVGGVDAVRYCDSKVVLLATKYGINPPALGLVFTKGGDKGAHFIDCEGKNKGRFLGCVNINTDFICDLEPKEFIVTIDDLMRKVEKDKKFLSVVERYKHSKRKIERFESRKEERGEE